MADMTGRLLVGISGDFTVSAAEVVQAGRDEDGNIIDAVAGTLWHTLDAWQAYASTGDTAGQMIDLFDMDTASTATSDTPLGAQVVPGQDGAISVFTDLDATQAWLHMPGWVRAREITPVGLAARVAALEAVVFGDSLFARLFGGGDSIYVQPGQPTLGENDVWLKPAS